MSFTSNDRWPRYRGVWWKGENCGGRLEASSWGSGARRMVGTGRDDLPCGVGRKGDSGCQIVWYFAEMLFSHVENPKN